MPEDGFLVFAIYHVPDTLDICIVRYKKDTDQKVQFSSKHTENNFELIKFLKNYVLYKMLETESLSCTVQQTNCVRTSINMSRMVAKSAVEPPPHTLAGPRSN